MEYYMNRCGLNNVCVSRWLDIVQPAAHAV